MTNHDAILASAMQSPDVLSFLTAAFATKPSEALASLMARTVGVVVSVDAKNLLTPRPRGKAKKVASKPIGVTMMVTEGKLTASEFLDAIRGAGKRQGKQEYTITDEVTGEIVPITDMMCALDGKPILVHDSVEQKIDERSAIAAYVGYDLSAPHGSQLDSAIRTAQADQRRCARNAAGEELEIAPHRDPVAHEQKWSIAGFVAGTPRPLQKLLGDLGARERLAATDFSNFGKLRQYAMSTSWSDYEKLLKKEYPSGTGKQARMSADNMIVGYDVVEVPNPIVVSLEGKKGEKLINALAMLEALAFERLEEIRRDMDSINLDPASAWQAVQEYSTREYHAPIRVGEEALVETIRVNGKGVVETKMARFEARQDEMAALWELSMVAKDGDDRARRECYEWTVARTHASLASRGAPTIEEAVALLNDTPKA